MDSIKVLVHKKMDGYTFSILPSTRQYVKNLSPSAHPASTIFVAYDIKSDFEFNNGRLEKFILPALLGLQNLEELDNFPPINFVDSFTDKVLYQITPHEQEVQFVFG